MSEERVLAGAFYPKESTASVRIFSTSSSPCFPNEKNAGKIFWSLAIVPRARENGAWSYKCVFDPADVGSW